jgi:hypothetical protein
MGVTGLTSPGCDMPGGISIELIALLAVNIIRDACMLQKQKG